MIIVFHISDSQGLQHRCSAICGPSTTAVGAINQLRSKLCIPTEVEVEVHLANDVPIRHLTAPLTSLRKQRGGSAQVLRMQLWASLSGPEAAVREINYSTAEAVDPADAAAEDEDDNVAPPTLSQSERRSSDCTAHVSSVPTTRIMFAGPPSRANVKPVQAKMPSSISTPVHARPAPHVRCATAAAGSSANPPSTSEGVAVAATPVKNAGSRKPSPVTTVPDSAEAASTPSITARPPESTATSTAASASTLVIKRLDSRPPRTPRMEMPLSARGPVRRPPMDVQWAEKWVPQSARGVAHALAPPVARAGTSGSNGAGAGATSNGRHAEAAGEGGATLHRTGCARRDAAIAHLIMREYPKIVRREPKAIVAAVKDNPHLASLSFSAEFTAASDLDGVDDATYARCLSAGLTHGLELRSGGAAASGSGSDGSRLALYGELSSLRHSCCPNAAVQYDLFAAPYAGNCRCAVLSGIPQGQEITYLYKHADSLAFLLLSRDRRRNILQRKYFMVCKCPRCTEVVEDTEDIPAPIVKKKGSKTGTASAKPQKIFTRTKAQREAEETLTGAFFTDSTVDRDAKKQRALMEEMRKDFGALQIIDDTGVDITLSLVGNVPPIQRTKQCNRLLSFLRKYGTPESVLRLHEHHWRMNLARAAYVQETVRLCAVKGATPEARLRDPHSETLFTPTKTVYDVCLKQLAVEALFIPAGHPHSLTTYESFLYLVAILPPSLAQTVTRAAHNTVSIKWKQLEETKEAWSVLKRTALPPQVRQLLQHQESNHSNNGGTTASAELPSQPVTARGPGSHDLLAAPTVKLPPKKATAKQKS
ncbi:hypothetical protein N2W54_005962 [Lotmaria passim]